jgi:hypothetical protein
VKIAACTIAHNEAMFLPIWSRYYGSALGAEATFVVDHGSTDASIGCLPRATNVMRLPRDVTDDYARTAFVQHFVNSLLIHFDVVIFGDTDEIVVPDPAVYASLQAFCEAAPEVTAPTGVNVFQAIDREGAIDLRLPILGQRRYCQFRSDFCKPIIVKKAVTWAPGFHFGSEMPHISRDAVLFHLKSIDTLASLARLERTRAPEQWHPSNLRDFMGHNQRISDAEHVEQCFATPTAELDKAANLSFDFAADLDRLQAETVLQNGLYAHAAFSGKVAEIPERFSGRF